MMARKDDKAQGAKPEVDTVEHVNEADRPAPEPELATSADVDAVTVDIAEGDHETLKVAAELQHPSLVGQADLEVAQRSADQHRAKSDEHVKDFVVGPMSRTEPARDFGSFDHAANIDATRQYMIASGLRPVGDVVFEGWHNHPDGISRIARYVVKAVPAAVAEGDEVEHPAIPIERDSTEA